MHSRYSDVEGGSLERSSRPGPHRKQIQTYEIQVRGIALPQPSAAHGVLQLLVSQAQLTIRRTERPHPTSPSGLLGPEFGDAPNAAWSNFFDVSQSNSNTVVQGPLHDRITPFVDHLILPNGNQAMPAKAPRSAGASRSEGITGTGHQADETARDEMNSGTLQAFNSSRVSVGHSVAPPPYSQIE